MPDSIIDLRLPYSGDCDLAGSWRCMLLICLLCNLFLLCLMIFLRPPHRQVFGKSIDTCCASVLDIGVLAVYHEWVVRPSAPFYLPQLYGPAVAPTMMINARDRHIYKTPAADTRGCSQKPLLQDRVLLPQWGRRTWSMVTSSWAV